MLLRNAGRLVFLDLVDRTGRLQVMIGKKQVGPDTWPVVGCLDLGDIIGVEGRLGYSNSGEMTIFASSLTFLTKSLRNTSRINTTASSIQNCVNECVISI